MSNFETTIQTYLENRAKTDSLFAETYKKANKSIKECCKYIYSRARKQAAGKANGLSQMCQKCPLTYNPETLICQACDKSFKEGFQKGAKWLEKKRIDRIMNKDKEVQNDNRK
ncbi:Cas9 inhibitor AcrIIA9 family protein [Phocaeicola coprocola]|uniref:Cas9 inhibitor AcrIIA9 family protein n=1 Tax=Phocaeicola coprocola TaxID=310298 RepID=UPI001C38D7CA|nr:Cas9 inhibitor AcrIIA9 family protein [Phocaeicola coprocola]MBV3865805.1 PcfK-like family protein [Phocaeicola coprocola]MBV4006983.1 PcfK-like family protein [Phocaeicola coprocola]MBV4031411.1 PcfK-like family protein [Phocaeicola coprocola]MBV4037996.1 PcfK-like family protein [Phocaeicola coprocola]MBV4059637.1 PcfK-like family protein [Phocaeicola coprocola]